MKQKFHHEGKRHAEEVKKLMLTLMQMLCICVNGVIADVTEQSAIVRHNIKVVEATTLWKKLQLAHSRTTEVRHGEEAEGLCR